MCQVSLDLTEAQNTAKYREHTRAPVPKAGAGSPRVSHRWVCSRPPGGWSAFHLSGGPFHILTSVLTPSPPLPSLSRSPCAALIYIHCGSLKPLLNNEGAWNITTKEIWLDSSLHRTGAIIRQDCERSLHPRVQPHTNGIGRTLVW